MQSLAINKDLLLVFDNIIDSNGVARVKQDAALAANFEDFISVIGTPCSHKGRAVDSALSVALPLELNVAFIAPEIAPAVTNQPVVVIKLVGSVANQLNSCKKSSC